MFGSFFFFFKQKTAYEIRISDWSSDVCSSDLVRDPHAADQHREPGQFLIMRIIGGKDHLEMIGHAAGEFDETADNAGIAADLAERQPGDDEPAEHQQRDLDDIGQRHRLEDRKSTSLNSSH